MFRILLLLSHVSFAVSFFHFLFFLFAVFHFLSVSYVDVMSNVYRVSLLLLVTVSLQTVTCMMLSGCAMLGGRCINELEGYRCVCPPGHSGVRCDVDEDACVVLQPCLHGGRCVDGPGESFHCVCRHGYFGPLCQFTDDDISCSMHVDTNVSNEQRCPEGAMCVAVRSTDGHFRFRCKFPVYIDLADDVSLEDVSSTLMTSSGAQFPMVMSYDDDVIRQVRLSRWQAVILACVVGAALTTLFVNVMIVVGVRRRRRDVITGISRRVDDVIGWGNSSRDVGPMNNAVACVDKSNAVKPRRLSEPNEMQRNPSVGHGHVTTHLPGHVNNCRF